MYMTILHLASFLCFILPWNILSAPIYQYHRDPLATEAFASRDYFYVGGEYVTISTNNTLFVNQMYVEHIVPSRIEQPYPIVFIHGQGMTGTVRTIPFPSLDYFLSLVRIDENLNSNRIGSTNPMDHLDGQRISYPTATKYIY